MFLIRHHFDFKAVLILILFALASCTSAPKSSHQNVTEVEAKEWFGKYCSKGFREISGDLVLRSTTKEFKGQFPGNVHLEKNGSFVLEVTNILGGTLMRLQSDGREMSTTVPSKPKYNRSHISHYMGLDIPVLTQLLMGDLPCPVEWKSGGVRASQNQMQIITSNWKWNFEKAEASAGRVPVKIILEPRVSPANHNALSTPMNSTTNSTVELLIENWDQDSNYAKKVTVKSAEGELRWTWRARN